jgi:ribosome-associated protein
VTPESDLVTARGLVVPAAALQWTFARSGGAGGQNVNKVATRAVLRVRRDDVEGRAILKDRLAAALPDTITVSSQTARSQWRNRQLCQERLIEILDRAAAPPPRERRATRPTKGSVERRLTSKKKASQRKSERRRVSDD